MKSQFFSAPGRVEIGGNHTDHQRGRVLTAAVDLKTKCEAKANGTSKVYLTSAGFGETVVDLNELSVIKGETGTVSSLVRGVAAWFSQNSLAVGGFDAHVTSDVPVGSGLSSSAAFEVMIGNVFKGLFGSRASKLEIALAGQYAENAHFGKPSGLMDQAASSFGGLNMFDFYDPEKPEVTHIDMNLSDFSLCVVQTGGSHEDLTHDYAAIPSEMKTVAAHFEKEFLRHVGEDDFYASLGRLRHLSDRAALRAIHFFDENERVIKQAGALLAGDMDSFLNLVNESGNSSIMYLQNGFSSSVLDKQGIMLAVALSARILKGKGAWRVHGGGFAGTVLAFVPDDLKDEYKRVMTVAFGETSCVFLNIIKEGGMELQS